MIEKEKSLLQNEEKASKKPLSDDELSSLIKASKNNKFNEVELKVKKNENESFKKIIELLVSVRIVNIICYFSKIFLIGKGGLIKK